MTAPAHAPVRRRRAVAAFAAVVAMLVLAACGGRIDTTLALTGDGSGERIMRVTLSASDAEDVEGGAEAIERSVRAHLPEQLTMSEVEETDDGFVTTMTLAFTSLEDYTAKVAALLEASGSDITPEIEHMVSDTAFLRGTSLNENFTSADLLGWVGPGLLADKLVEQDAADAAVENGSTVATVGETEFESGSYVWVSDVDDRGMRAVTATTSRAENGFTRVVVLEMPSATYETDAEALDAAVAALVPAGGSVDAADADGDRTWTVTFSGDAAAIATGTDTLLGTTGSVWSWTESQGEQGQVVEIVDSFTCGTTCSPRMYGPTALHVVPESWVDGSDSWADHVVDGQAHVRSDLDGAVSVYRVPLEVARVDADLVLDRFGAGTATLVFSLPTTAAGDGSAIEAALRPTDGAGSITRTDDGTTTRVVVTFTGVSADALGDLLEEYAGIGYSARDESSFFGIDLAVRLELDLARRLQTAPSEGAHVSVRLPFGAKVEGSSSLGDGVTIDGRTVTWVDTDGWAQYVRVDVAGTTLAGIVRNIVGGVLVLAVAGVVVWQRRRIATWWRATQAASAERTAALAAAPAVHGTPAGYGAPAANAPVGAGAGVPGPDGVAPEEFTEAQLR